MSVSAPFDHRPIPVVWHAPRRPRFVLLRRILIGLGFLAAPLVGLSTGSPWATPCAAWAQLREPAPGSPAPQQETPGKDAPPKPTPSEVAPAKPSLDERWPAGPVELFPDTTLAYAEVTEPRRLVASLIEHPVTGKLHADEKYQPLLATPEYARFRLGLGVVELAMGMGWRRAVEQLTEGGLAVGYDGRTGGFALVSRAADPATPSRLLKLGLKLARDDARNKGRPDPIETMEYRGVAAFRIDRLKLAVHGPWLVATDNDELGKQFLNRLLDGPGDGVSGLANDPWFASLRKARSHETLVWTCVRLDKLRESGKASGLFGGKADDPVGEMLFGGILNSLQHANSVAASIESRGPDFVARVSLPFDPAWIPEDRSYYFGDKAEGVAPDLLRPAGTILNFSTYRDLSALWNSGPDLFDEAANAKLNEANSGLSTLFSGRDFSRDVLGAIRPEWQVVVARQDYAQSVSEPQIKLPAGGLVVRLREPEKGRREWKVTFQSLIGFLNVVSSMQGQPPLELDSEKVGDLQLYTASYLPPEEGRQPAPGALQYNFSPSLALTPSRMIIASTRGLALELARATTDSRGAEPMPQSLLEANRTGEGSKDSLVPPRINTQVAIEVAPLTQSLLDNRDQLVARNMLEKGHGREDAEREIDTLLKLAELVRDLDVRLQRVGERLELVLRLGLKK